MRRSELTPRGWTTGTIASRLSSVFPGEWGSDPSPGKEATSVLRSTNLDDEGHVDLSTGADRQIPQIKLATKELRPGDILLEASGGGPGKPVGRVALFEGGAKKHICSNFFRTLRPNSQIHSGYLAWRLLHLYESPGIWNFQQQTTGLINLNLHDYLDQDLAWPPLVEQARIAEVLDTLDEAIQKETLITQKLLTMKSALLHSVFMEEPGLTKGGKGTQRGNLVRLGSICKTMSGGTPSRSVPMYWNGDIPWVKTGEINYLDILSTEECITSEGLKSSAARLFPPGTVLMAMYGEGVTRGKVAMLGIEAATNQACLAFFPNQQLRSRYLYWWLCSAYELLRSISADGSQKNLSSKIIEDMQVPIKSTEEQEKVTAIFDSIDSHLRQEQSVRDALVAIKSGLSADLLSGRVRTTLR